MLGGEEKKNKRRKEEHVFDAFVHFKFQKKEEF